MGGHSQSMGPVDRGAITKPAAVSAGYAAHFVPKLLIALREGYSSGKFASDALAGLTVAILALPLSMAIAIGAGVSPDRGLVTSVVAGFFISALGGSRYQVGGPAAAFIVIVADVAAKHGVSGLMTATFLAGFVLIAAGLLRVGSYIKYVPGPVILGFTSGIGIVIALSQIKDFLGLQGDVPGEVVHKMEALWAIRGTFNVWAFALACLTLIIISVMRAWRPAWPGLLVAVVIASVVAFAFGLPVETIGSRFGGIPSSLPKPELPDLSPATIRDLLPAIMTIAFLIGVESLLSAVAADAKTGGRHRSNIEVVAQGVANVASPLFGGLPATGVIARTGTNITAGAKTPVAGILHAGFVLLFMLLLAPLASYLILPCLAAVLINVAWRLIDWREVSHFMMRAPTDDRVVLGVTLLLTVLVDLTAAISVGVVLACILFMHRMAVASGNGIAAGGIDDSDLDDVRGPRSAIATMPLPDEIAVFHLRGPLFFGGAGAIRDALATRASFPRVLILRLRDVPLVDATALSALEELAMDCDRHECRIILTGLQKQPRVALHKLGLPRRHKMLLASNSFIALEKAKALLGGSEGLAPT